MAHNNTKVSPERNNLLATLHHTIAKKGNPSFLAPGNRTKFHSVHVKHEVIIKLTILLPQDILNP